MGHHDDALRNAMRGDDGEQRCAAPDAAAVRDAMDATLRRSGFDLDNMPNRVPGHLTPDQQAAEMGPRMLLAIREVVKHWKGRDWDAAWIQPLKEFVRDADKGIRDHAAYTRERRSQ